MKNIVILGSTGSIGENALAVCRNLPGRFKIAGLSANSRVDILSRQIKEFRPWFVSVNNKEAGLELKSKIGTFTKVFIGDQGLELMLEDKRINAVLLAISGSACLLPLLKAIDKGKEIALANKEALVMAGPMIMRKALEKKIRIIPIDSEQSAIWQCLDGRDKQELKNIYLTASGGPFRELNRIEFKGISVKDTLRHPRWQMGRKITVDSATLMNKGLEILEAMYLFNVPVEKIKVLVHPEAIIHSMVEFIDGVVMAQLSVTDMRIPIQYALTYPKRLSGEAGRVDFYKLRRMNFDKPDLKKFPCLGLAYLAAKEKGTVPAVLNAGNEISVDEFLKGNLKFINIPKVIEKVISRHKKIRDPNLEQILRADNWARQEAHRIINK
ncbi:MAG: 1-deoxy-D-xylulose-5-phosphate reductoisomerase [Candidatus Omnitrophota bacterium]|nr:1-deoxy-D-xylulose-5-phosphate reductoisomerase [Candidatus Omnitrophota bacterium]MBU1929608.1 1-deoxy-D-xylulose-5-phosphate reductoisomerase [Candidatus Omnitrophota bacterium]MBU2034801.1 1-deoxy-D-xylulose-5-phosphate reductoisomerase [Candidatus Omnitrophota bacterium]MBU2222281.1 1-deoxy-D-xylulose-5-phosphate reductoisomerase [Candidatus Omnitrophota bacterium]